MRYGSWLASAFAVLLFIGAPLNSAFDPTRALLDRLDVLRSGDLPPCRRSGPCPPRKSRRRTSAHRSTASVDEWLPHAVVLNPSDFRTPPPSFQCTPSSDVVSQTRWPPSH